MMLWQHLVIGWASYHFLAFLEFWDFWHIYENDDAAFYLQCIESFDNGLNLANRQVQQWNTLVSDRKYGCGIFGVSILKLWDILEELGRGR